MLIEAMAEWVRRCEESSPRLASARPGDLELWVDEAFEDFGSVDERL